MLLLSSKNLSNLQPYPQLHPHPHFQEIASWCQIRIDKIKKNKATVNRRKISTVRKFSACIRKSNDEER